ncbi:hypothetical protein AA0114_g11792 [Alternaria tenuissima]|uniref:Heterokaryon incompatibility domain-containing protein n=1 Tax=Alternaria tenuissima TaxID=119927 RepID=A0A4Q4M1L9_9PLEO|nr:hypothetical protein AA0114_g11792 [Alternaria tenuissima]
MALDRLKARFKKFKTHNSDDTRGGVSTKTLYGKRPLLSDEIRLLTVEHNAGILRLRMNLHKLQDGLEYDAISYVWGAAEASINVSCNGIDLAVTPTVFEMLQNLDPSGQYWLDSICINQQDVEEKAVQVPLMHRIYSRAALVVIWMGMSTTQSAKFMAEFPSLLEKERKWISMVTRDIQPWINAKDLLVNDENILHGMLHILDNEWFERLWTFQECVLAKQPIILHGGLSINFDEFLKYTHDGWYGGEPYLDYSLSQAGVHTISYRVLEPCRTLKLYRKHFEEHGVVSYNWMPYLLHTLRSRNAKEPVDRAWAIAGLFSEALRSKLDPLVDYSDSGRLDFWRTHILFAKTIMVEGKTLGLLKIPSTIEGKPCSVPSWCPALGGTWKHIMVISGSWTEPINRQEKAPLLEEVVEEADQARPAGALDQLSSLYLSRKFISLEDDTYLKTRGHMVDTISEVVDDPQLQGNSDYIMSATNPMGFISNPIHAANVGVYSRSLILARRTVHRTNDCVDSIPPDYLMTLLCDTRLSKDATAGYEDAWTVFTDLEHTNFERLSGGRRSQAKVFYQVLKGLSGHSFFSTAGGRFGVATPGCKPGDRVCVFYGEPPLHILRWSGSENGTGAIHGEGPAEFCGVAYIPHLMKPHEQEVARLGPDETFVIG